MYEPRRKQGMKEEAGFVDWEKKTNRRWRGCREGLRTGDGGRNSDRHKQLSKKEDWFG